MTHKESFQKSPFAKGYTDVIDGQQMQAAFNSAMLYLQSTFPLASDMATAAANEWRRQGAVQFLSILQNLTANEKPPAPPVVPALNPRY